MKTAHSAGQQEVHGSQSQNSENVGGKDDQRLPRDGKNGRYGIDRENDIGSLNKRKRHQQRRREQLSLNSPKEPVPFAARGDRDAFPQKPQDWTSIKVYRALGSDQHLGPGQA